MEKCKWPELVECPVCKGAGQDLYDGKDCEWCAGRGFVCAPPKEEKDGCSETVLDGQI